MATIQTRGLFVPFTLPLKDDGFVGVSKNLLGLRFNLQIGSMYVEHEMYSKEKVFSKTILMHKTRKEDGTMWIMGPSSFRVIEIFESHMLSSSFSQMKPGHRQSNCQHSQLLIRSPSKMMFWCYFILRVTFVQQWIYLTHHLFLEVQLRFH